MACAGLRPAYRALLRDASRTTDIPSFLLPALSQPCKIRQFSTSDSRQSRVGTTAISIPEDVTLRFYDLPNAQVNSRRVDEPTRAVEVKGPLGELNLHLPPYLITEHDQEAKKVSLTVGDPSIKHQKAMWGTMRAHIQNSVSGVSEGHICILRLVGVGYRATIENTAITIKPEYPGQKFVSLKLGFAHPVELGIPEGVKATVPQPTRILLEGCDKQVVTQFAAEIRAWRKPEPYKGKGIFVNDETIKLKAKKIK